MAAMSRVRDLTKEPPFGRLTVKRRGENSATGAVRWWCQCACGKETLVYKSNLLTGKTQSCGCFEEESKTLRGKHYMTGTREYAAWANMKKRCLDPSNPHFKEYGGRGITILWQSFEAFYADMGPCPSAQHTIDRYPDNNGPYSKENCRWATPKEQARNRRSTHWVTMGDTTQSLAAWCEQLNIRYSTVAYRIRSGYDPVQALLTPMKPSADKYSRNAKLIPEQVVEIRARYASGQETPKSLAEEYHVDKSLIYLIVNRRIWIHI